MTKVILIKDCNSCGHKGHSGNFTKGGAYPLCRAMRKDDALGTPQESPGYKGKIAILPWRYEVIEILDKQKTVRRYTHEIPKWCPLTDLEDVCKEVK